MQADVVSSDISPTAITGSKQSLTMTAEGRLRTDAVLSASDRVSSASLSSLASAATSAQLIAANTARRGLLVVNTDANAVLIKYGTTATASSFSVRIAANGYWEMPSPVYTGRIDAIWEADGSGSAFVTEL